MLSDYRSTLRGIFFLWNIRQAGPYREMEVEQCLIRESEFGLGERWVLGEADWGSSAHT